jgi:hypothetical protein
MILGPNFKEMDGHVVVTVMYIFYDENTLMLSVRDENGPTNICLTPQQVANLSWVLHEWMENKTIPDDKT